MDRYIDRKNGKYILKIYKKIISQKKNNAFFLTIEFEYFLVGHVNN